MPCFYPIDAFQEDDGSVVFQESKHTVKVFKVPCGQCDGCKLERARQWAVRCMHEASLYERNCFITLTYNDEHLPLHGLLVYDEFQRFMKRLRKRFKGRRVRFFMCGEYGEDHDRPHFHACLFNFDFDDRVYFKTSPSGSKIYTSKILDSLWCGKGGDSFGFATVGDVDFNSAGYVARYTLKKSVGRGSDINYQTVDMETGEVFLKPREFTHMSLKPGIGAGFYRKWFSDIFPRDYCVVNGVPTKPPIYYFKKLKDECPEMYDEVVFLRGKEGVKHSGDAVPDRLEVREKVLKARIKFLKRELI